MENKIHGKSLFNQKVSRRELLTYSLLIGVGGIFTFLNLDRLKGFFTEIEEKTDEKEALKLIQQLVMGWDEFVYTTNPKGWMPYVKQDLLEHPGLLKMINKKEIDIYSLTRLYNHKNKTKKPIDRKKYQRPVWHPGLKNKGNSLEKEIQLI